MLAQQVHVNPAFEVGFLDPEDQVSFASFQRVLFLLVVEHQRAGAARGLRHAAWPDL